MKIEIDLERDSYNTHPSDQLIISDEYTDMIQLELSGVDRTVCVDKKEFKKVFKILLEDA